MIHNKFRYLLTLVALFAISTGAWAQEEVLLTTVTPTSKTTYSQSPDGIVTVTLNNIEDYHSTYGWLENGTVTVEAPQGYTITRCVFRQNAKTPLEDDLAPFTATMVDYQVSAETSTGQVNSGQMDGITSIEVYGYLAEAPIAVTPVAEPAANTKQWTFSMPGSDVVLTPLYAPAAQLDENGAPAAVTGLEIAADAAIITAGQSAQGTLLYAVGTSATEKPALTAFAATLPNAKDQTAAGNYYVWYYIQGHDTPQGQEPTAENTFNDSEIMGPVMVELLTNEHTLNIKQSPNITVTVAGTAKTVTDDKVTPVTTGQEVKIKAKDGYKFRKVEVKKGGAAPAETTITWDNTNVFGKKNVTINKLNKGPVTYEGISVTFTGSGAASTLDINGIQLYVNGNQGGEFTFTAPSGKQFTKIVITDEDFVSFTDYGDWKRNDSTTFTWSGTPSNTVTLGPSSGSINVDPIKSIVFTLVDAE